MAKRAGGVQRPVRVAQQFAGQIDQVGPSIPDDFVGLHGLQVLPVLGLLVAQLGGSLTLRRRTALIWIGGLSYFGVVALLTWQALRGQALLAPDAATWMALAGLGTATALSVVATLAWPRSK